MATQNLYEYVVIKRAVKKEDKDVIVAGPEKVMASSEAVVHSIAIRAVPDAEAENLEQLEVQVRPFGCR